MQSQNTTLHHNNALCYLTYPLLDQFSHIRHATSTRLGGVTQTDHLASMNLGVNTGDSLENIRKNYALFCDAAGITLENVVLSSQYHHANIRFVTPGDAGKGLHCPMDYQDVDGLITNHKNLPLAVFSADCVPLLFADPERQVIGAAHCGWAGTIQKLAPKMVEAMVSRYGCRKESIFAVTGPAIRSCCYEVSEDLYQRFWAELPCARGEACLPQRKGHFYLDLPSINRALLLDAGLPADQILNSDLCTCCNSTELFSHRASKGKRGVLASMIELV